MSPIRVPKVALPRHGVRRVSANSRSRPSDGDSCIDRPRNPDVADGIFVRLDQLGLDVIKHSLTPKRAVLAGPTGHSSSVSSLNSSTIRDRTYRRGQRGDRGVSPRCYRGRRYSTRLRQNDGSSVPGVSPTRWLPLLRVALLTRPVAYRMLAPSSSTSSSTSVRFSPFEVSKLRCLSRPWAITRAPLARDSARCSPAYRHSEQRRNSVSPSCHSPLARS